MTSNNVAITSEEEAKQYLNLLQTSTSFDEVLPEPITVTWVEYVPFEVTLEDGRKVTRRKPVNRKSEINTYVPVVILHKMMASQEKLKKLQAIRAKNAEIDSGMQQEMIGWMHQQVLNVWQLTEPDMTLDKLSEGIDFKKTFGLFNCFFGNLLTGLSKP